MTIDRGRLSCRVRRHIGYLLRLAAGVALLYSGLIHGWQPYYFADHVAAYGILPPLFIAVVMLLLPYAQIFVGVTLVASTKVFFSSFLASCLLFASFFLAQLKIIIAGETIQCGCWGFASERVSWQSATIPAVLLVGVSVSWWLERTIEEPASSPVMS